MQQQRRLTTQSVAWFLDLHRRKLLDLEPPYQRRSVWSPSFKEYFIDTILIDYPAPAIFLHEEIDDNGVTNYAVVDGKQRLTTIFEFIEGVFPVGDSASHAALRGLSFPTLPSDVKKKVYSYQFSIEFLPSTDEATLNNIFDRINRNVSRLTPQELRHAKFSGPFAQAAEQLAEELPLKLKPDMPRFNASARRQMKDVEYVVQLLLMVEQEAAGQHSQVALDAAYSEREDEWERGASVISEYRDVIDAIATWFSELTSTTAGKRYGNQADFYSLFGAVRELKRDSAVPPPSIAVQRLTDFMTIALDPAARAGNPAAQSYFEATRSASSDVGPRRERIQILKRVLVG